MSEINQWQSKATRCYWITTACFIGLFALILVAQLLHEFSFKKLAVQWLPLVIFIPGFLRRTQHRTYTWLCFVLLIYFTAYVVEVGSPLRHWTDIIGLLLTSTLFVSAMFTSRYTQRWQYELYQAQIAENTNEANKATGESH